MVELEASIADLASKLRQHREILETEEAAKTTLVLPFLRALGYDIFNPAEVKPEFTCDVGTKKGEKVDYALCVGGEITTLVECKPVTSELSIKHASQLLRYFAATFARLSLLTNGVVYQFYTDSERARRAHWLQLLVKMEELRGRRKCRTFGRAQEDDRPPPSGPD